MISEQNKMMVATLRMLCLMAFCGFALTQELVANEKLPLAIGKEFDRIQQGLHPFNTIEFEYMRYTSWSNNNMPEEADEKGNLLWDRRENAFYFKNAECVEKKNVYVREAILRNGRIHTVSRQYKEGAKLTPIGEHLAPKYAIEVTNYTGSEQPLSLFDLFRAWEFRRSPLDVNGKPLYTLFREKKITPNNFLKKGKHLELHCGGFIYTFDPATGLLLSQRITGQGGSNEIIEFTTELSEYETFNGVPFPLCIKFTNKINDKSIITRFQIKKETLRINERIKPEVFKFSFPIPKGTLIVNRSEGTMFRSTGTDGAIPIEDIGKELDDIFEEAEKRR